MFQRNFSSSLIYLQIKEWLLAYISTKMKTIQKITYLTSPNDSQNSHNKKQFSYLKSLFSINGQKSSSKFKFKNRGRRGNIARAFLEITDYSSVKLPIIPQTSDDIFGALLYSSRSYTGNSHSLVQTQLISTDELFTFG